jgi:hypothetical protein
MHPKLQITVHPYLPKTVHCYLPTTNENHHFKYAIWIITKSGKESPLNIICFNILSFF